MSSTHNLTEKMRQEIFLLATTKKDEVSYRSLGEKTKLSDGNTIGASIMSDMKDAVLDLQVRRMGSAKYAAEDISFGEYALERWGFPSMAAVLNACGVDPSKVTIQNLYALPDLPSDSRWIVPEVFLEPIRTGFRKPAMFQELIRDTINVSQASITVPEIKMADAGLTRLAEGETIPMGTISFGQKQGRVHKLGRGFNLTDEVVMFSTINLLAPFLEDLGTKMNMSQNALAIKILIEGEVAGGASAAAVIGVADTAKGFQYKDFVKSNARFDRLGSRTDIAIVNEDSYVSIKDMQEVKGLLGTNQLLKIDEDIKMMTSQAMRVHGLVPANCILFVDKAKALRRLMAKPLTVESERIVGKQTNVVYATTMLGFMTFLRDGRFLMDSSQAYSSAPFPSFMDPAPYENVEFAY